MKDYMKERLDDRGQVGIGTLIVFIAMVLVAAIAAGVLINTAGFLQNKSEQTGQEASSQVSNRVQIVSGFGAVGNDEKVREISLTVMRGSGAEDINLSSSTIEWIGPNEATTLIYSDSGVDDSHFTVDVIKDTDGSSPVLDAQSDRLKITMDATQIGGALGEGDEVSLKITTQYGSVTPYRVNVPQSLDQQSAVTL